MRDDAEEINRKAREIVAQHKRERELAKWHRGPVDDHVVPIAADWRSCKSVKEMTSRQFSQWCDDGRPPLMSANRTHAYASKVTRSQVDERVRTAIDRERANLQATLQTVVEIIGEECGKNEKALRAEIEAKLDLVRAEISKAQRGDDGIIDLPDDWRPHVEH